MEEIWKDVVGYEGLYQVSNLGRVKSLDRFDSEGKHINEKILKQTISGAGYLSVMFSKNGKTKRFLVHILVAKHFIENKDNLPQVSHIDETMTNNCVSNLKWSTVKDNINMPLHKERSSTGHKYTGGVKVFCNGKIYPTILSCAIDNNLNKETIRSWLRGKYKMPQEWVDKGLKLL